MKTIIASLLIAAAAPSYAQTLLEHVAFASKSITAGCSDFLGRTASAGDITLRDFRINMLNDGPGCPVRAGGEFRLLRGSIEKQGNRACVEARRARVGNANLGPSHRLKSDLSILTTELYQISNTLMQNPPENSVRAVLTQDNFSPGSTLTLIGSGDATLILEVRGQRINIQHVGLRLTNGLRPSKIVWVFPDATEVLIDRSGVNPVEYGQHIGMPGLFFAPWARVVFLNSLITGGLYAHEIAGPAAQVACTGQVSGQINPLPAVRIMPGKI